ncbi:MAG: RnfABCDGE type electron transport complex subunit C [Bacilli bacterium]|nr:RnfABCDGE type electron transport complex subunit C [Bacilli bacterium]
MRVLGLDKATIGVEGNKLDAVEHLKNLLPTGETGICIRTLRTRYPQGGEKQLIQRITGRKVPPGGVSADVGCCVFNAGTAAAVYNAVVLGLPLTHRIVTVTGDAVARPKNLMVPLGTSFSHLIEEAGGFVMDPARVISGGPMMGTAQHDLSVTTDKTTNAVLCLAAGDLPAPQREQVCLRCGRCVDVCPMRLAPLYIHMYTQRQLWRRVEDLHAMDCMECGCCQYICPARIPLLQSLRTSKFEIAHRKGAEA